MLQFSTENKIRINLCWNFPHKTKFGSTSVGIFQTNKFRISLCWTFFYKKKFGSTSVGLFPIKKKNSNQPILQLSWQNKIRTNLCCNFPHKTKFGLTYVAIVQTKKIRINLCCTFFYKKKENSNQAILQLFWQNKIRINLFCNFPHKTKFGSTCVGIFYAKQNCNLCWNFPHKTKFGSTSVGLFSTKKNLDQAILQLSWQNKIRINLSCKKIWKEKNLDLFQPRLVSTFRYTYVGLLSTKKKKKFGSN